MRGKLVPHFRIKAAIYISKSVCLIVLTCSRSFSAESYCHSSPCMNSGVCVEKPGGFSCICADRWTGQQCQGFSLCHCFFLSKLYRPFFIKTVHSNAASFSYCLVSKLSLLWLPLLGTASFLCWLSFEVPLIHPSLSFP